jgi:hypothetical protein
MATSQHAGGIGGDIRAIDQTFMVRAFYVFAVLAAASLALALAGRWFGGAIAMGGYTDDSTVHGIAVGQDVLYVPANAIRFAHSRRDGPAERLDLYLRWPDLSGYSKSAADDFNNAGGRKDILFLSFEPRMMSRGMSDRFEPIYRSLIMAPGTPAEDGLTLYDFKPDIGYVNEKLAVAPRQAATPFVARCLTGAAAEESLAPCQRDVQIGTDLSLTYRFPRELLGDWQALDAAVVARANGFLKSGNAAAD